MTYLGVQIFGDRPRKHDWLKLTLSINNRLVAWNSRHLSLGGRIVLVNYPTCGLSAIPTYWMSVFELPPWVR